MTPDDSSSSSSSSNSSSSKKKKEGDDDEDDDFSWNPYITAKNAHEYGIEWPPRKKRK